MFWNLIRSTKQNPNVGDAIDTETLVNYFKHRFSGPAISSKVLECARRDLSTNYTNLVNTKHSNAERRNIIVIVASTNKYIKQLKRNSAAGYDGITAEHLIYAMDSNLPLHLSCLFSLCIYYGIIPDHFNNGLLVPIIKKASSDHSISTRPITISCVLSKILELYILDHCDFGINKAQFGYVKGCDTKMVTTLAHDDWSKLLKIFIKSKFKSKGFADTEYISILNTNNVKDYIYEIHKKFVISPIDKASNNFAIICKKFYLEVIQGELGISEKIKGNSVYKPVNQNIDNIIEKHVVSIKMISTLISKK